MASSPPRSRMWYLSSMPYIHPACPLGVNNHLTYSVTGTSDERCTFHREGFLLASFSFPLEDWYRGKLALTCKAGVESKPARVARTSPSHSRRQPARSPVTAHPFPRHPPGSSLSLAHPFLRNSQAHLSPSHLTRSNVVSHGAPYIRNQFPVR